MTSETLLLMVTKFLLTGEHVECSVGLGAMIHVYGCELCVGDATVQCSVIIGWQRDIALNRSCTMRAKIITPTCAFGFEAMNIH